MQRRFHHSGRTSSTIDRESREKLDAALLTHHRSLIAILKLAPRKTAEICIYLIDANARVRAILARRECDIDRRA